MKIRKLNKWIKALESGKYKFGKGRLHNLPEDSFCCLGVLADVEKLWDDDRSKCAVNGCFASISAQAEDAVQLPHYKVKELIDINDSIDTNSFAPVIARLKAWRKELQDANRKNRSL